MNKRIIIMAATYETVYDELASLDSEVLAILGDEMAGIVEAYLDADARNVKLIACEDKPI